MREGCGSAAIRVIAGRHLMTAFKRRTALMPRSKMGNVPVEVDGLRIKAKLMLASGRGNER